MFVRQINILLYFHRRLAVSPHIAGVEEGRRITSFPRRRESRRMSGLLAVRRAPAKTGQEMETSLKATPD